ncbi:alpha/beta hydrolase [Porticoccaceae bacterium]|jgi:pimeloyl-ACP methyl ester carboxylesterase|nr:alpha/beta hydrolase [Porticoccaceae bacterium]MDA8942035.1 alpha/beta hydrolase [Porticoccaceae bacterium]MDB2395588.1 alpha/beta hydrolase [Porticoccaceae bacterium]|tara:strand:- start:657 stop:1514 length:858 start_codon:yes stop_codon:yes gene_type:complete
MPIEFIRERNFEVNGLTLTAKEWGRSGSIPVIALHGWLDNAATYDRMLPFMENLHVIALDLAGHGRSSHRSMDSSYDIWIDIGEVIAVADQMGWERFALLGHSRGAVISGLIAGTFPDRITQVALIDGYVPRPHDADSAVKQVKQAIRESKRFGGSSPTYFSDFDRAIQARVNGFVPLQLEAATLLASRGVVEGPKGYYWANDQRLKAASFVKFSKEHLEGFFTAILARVLLIQAENSPFSPDRQQSEFFGWVPHMQIKKMPGSHHLHLEDEAEQVAKTIQEFFV